MVRIGIFSSLASGWDNAVNITQRTRISPFCALHASERG
jgi:hypothetical protein